MFQTFQKKKQNLNKNFLTTKNINNLILIFFCTLSIPLFAFYQRLNFYGGDEWLTSDWLISYKFGFIRRGLFGTLINLFEFFNVPKLIILNFLLSVFYLILYNLVIKIFASKKQNFISYLLLFSPIFLFFPIYDIRAAFRKELLGLICFLYIVKNIDKFYKIKIIIISQFLFFLSIYSSEVNFLIIPFLFWLFKIKNIKTKQIYPYLVISLSYIFIYLINFNSYSSKALKICNELINEGLSSNICNGSISAISLSFSENMNAYGTGNIFTEKFLGYILVLILGFLPLYFSKWFYTNLKMIIFSFIFYIPFFIISADWGRWIHIYIFCITVLYFISNKESVGNNLYNSIKVFLVFLYSLTWNVNHYYESPNTILVNIVDLNFSNYLYLVDLIYKY